MSPRRSPTRAQTDGEIQVTGSGDLVQTLLANDLVDEMTLWVFPVLLGTGKGSSRGDEALGLELTGTTTSSTGVAIQAYRRAGALSYGSFALDQ